MKTFVFFIIKFLKHALIQIKLMIGMAQRFSWRKSAKPSEDMGNGDVSQSSFGGHQNIRSK